MHQDHRSIWQADGQLTKAGNGRIHAVPAVPNVSTYKGMGTDV
jgi:hypothetical protein